MIDNAICLYKLIHLSTMLGPMVVVQGQHQGVTKRHGKCVNSYPGDAGCQGDNAEFARCQDRVSI